MENINFVHVDVGHLNQDDALRVLKSIKVDRLISPKEASELLGITTNTLANWEKKEKIKPVKTLGGHRRYRQSDIEKIRERK